MAFGSSTPGNSLDSQTFDWESMSGPTKTKAQKLANEAEIIALRKMEENKFACAYQWADWQEKPHSGLDSSSGDDSNISFRDQMQADGMGA